MADWTSDQMAESDRSDASLWLGCANSDHLPSSADRRAASSYPPKVRLNPKGRPLAGEWIYLSRRRNRGSLHPTTNSHPRVADGPDETRCGSLIVCEENMPTQPQYDVAIVGASIAGCAAATFFGSAAARLAYRWLCWLLSELKGSPKVGFFANASRSYWLQAKAQGTRFAVRCP
jgi:hypothetical protein